MSERFLAARDADVPPGTRPSCATGLNENEEEKKVSMFGAGHGTKEKGNNKTEGGRNTTHKGT
jgi:hypothetical protein